MKIKAFLTAVIVATGLSYGHAAASALAVEDPAPMLQFSPAAFSLTPDTASPIVQTDFDRFIYGETNPYFLLSSILRDDTQEPAVRPVHRESLFGAPAIRFGAIRSGDRLAKWIGDQKRKSHSGGLDDAALGAVASFVGMTLGGTYAMLLISAYVIGGTTNPLYSMLLAHTNDYLDHEDMAAASGGLVFINGLGAVSGPVVTGWLMDRNVIGPQAYFLVMLVLLTLISAYAGYRSTRRASVPVDETGPYAAVSPTATAYAMEVAQEYAIDTEREGQEDPETSRNVSAGRNL